MDVKSIAGDNFLGGEDFTELLFTHFLHTHDLNAEDLSAKTRSLIYKQAEMCKLALGQDNEAKMTVPAETGSLELRISRTEFE
ncbi:Hsp70 family protein, partial [Streptomyces sp. URMC 124]